ncbi:MAG: hypothetical protein ACI83P_002491 [Janthinobacterium sp.]|jgi:hypothetical protein
MKNIIKNTRLAALLGAVLLVAGCSSMGMKHEVPTSMAMGAGAYLSGANEVPANASTATGSSTVWVASNKTVTGKVNVSGLKPTAAHIHMAAAGANGPVILPLTKMSDEQFAVPDGATLTDAQYASYMAGNLYVNVHSAAHPGGELRVQLSPN